MNTLGFSSDNDRVERDKDKGPSATTQRHFLPQTQVTGTISRTNEIFISIRDRDGPFRVILSCSF